MLCPFKALSPQLHPGLKAVCQRAEFAPKAWLGTQYRLKRQASLPFGGLPPRRGPLLRLEPRLYLLAGLGGWGFTLERAGSNPASPAKNMHKKTVRANALAVFFYKRF